MASPLIFSMFYLGLVTLQLSLFHLSASSNVHIVYMGEKRHDEPELVSESHHHILSHVLGSKEAAEESIIYSYKHGFSGFAAVLTQTQAKHIADFPGVVNVIPNRILSLCTTRSWDFLQVSPDIRNGILAQSRSGSGSIIGVMDTGIWPESESFKDDGMGEIPSRWRGICQEGEQFNRSHCNRKIIGARWYIKGYEAEFGKLNPSDGVEFLSARDASGHGTHTSSTAAGALIENASFMGLASGVARGGAPSAWLAIYKVCWSTGGCSSADLLAAFDDAISDGVDVVSLSLGSLPPLPSYVEDVLSIGSFHAVTKGISVVCSGGNSGPYPQTVINTAPWILTVAASTIDRAFPAVITMGNNQSLVGQAVYTGMDVNKYFPLVYGEDIASINADEDTARSCDSGSLNETLARGKVVLCFQSRSQRSATVAASTVLSVNGTGLIFAKVPTKDVSLSWSLPSVQVDFTIGTYLLTYMEATSIGVEITCISQPLSLPFLKEIEKKNFATSHTTSPIANQCHFPRQQLRVPNETVIHRNPVIKFGPTRTALGQQISPEVAFFSSRGPSSLSPTVLKPDIAAPGVNILASWSPASSPLYYDAPGTKQLQLKFKLESGTSMSCPHISAVVALLKTIHPDWSPAAINSALITTASLEDEYDQSIVAEGAPHKQADPFDYGGGHVNPNKAVSPGLVYDSGISDYVQFLCSMGYNDTATSLVAGTPTKCFKSTNFLVNLNLPSITIPDLKQRLTVTRTVRNVGPENSVYTARIQTPAGVSVRVKPKILWFNSAVKELKFNVVFRSLLRIQGRYSFGNLFWEDGFHVVRIPLIVRTVIEDFYAET